MYLRRHIALVNTQFLEARLLVKGWKFSKLNVHKNFFFLDGRSSRVNRLLRQPAGSVASEQLDPEKWLLGYGRFRSIAMRKRPASHVRTLSLSFSLAEEWGRGCLIDLNCSTRWIVLRFQNSLQTLTAVFFFFSFVWYECFAKKEKKNNISIYIKIQLYAKMLPLDFKFRKKMKH